MPAPIRIHAAQDHDALALILRRAASRPEAPAVWDGCSRPLSAGQLVSRVRAVAGGLVRHGFTPGEQLRLVMAPSITSVTLALATVLAGGSAVINLEDRAEPPLTPLQAAPHAWIAADSMTFVSAAETGLRADGQASDSVRHPPPGKQWIHVGAWLPGVPRSALSLRRLGSGVLLAAPAANCDQPAVIAVTSTGAVTHTRQELGIAVAWLGEQIGLTEVDTLLTDSLALGLAALVVGAQWRIGTAADGRRDLDRVSVVGTTPAALDAVGAALRSADSSAGVVVWDGPIEEQYTRSSSGERSLVVLSGREGLLPVALVRDTDLQAFEGPGALLGSVTPGVRVLIDDDRILTHRDRGSLTGRGVLDTGLRGYFAGARLVALP